VVRAVGGLEEAQRQVFERERPLIERLARERADQGLSHDDLVQEGSLALLAAMHEFAGGVDGAFEPYVEQRVGEHMDRAIQEEQSALREEKQLAEDAAAFERTELLLRRELKRDPTAAEMSARLGWAAERLDDVAAAVEDARQRHDEELLPFLDPDYFDPVEWLGEDEDSSEPDGDGGA